MALKRHRALVPGGTDAEINEDTPHTLQIPNCDPREETTGLLPGDLRYSWKCLGISSRHAFRYSWNRTRRRGTKYV